MKKTIGIIVAVYNEEESLAQLHREFITLFNYEESYTFKVYFIENGSSDSSERLIAEICKSDQRFSMIKMSRNFRMDGALTAGLDFVQEDACVLMAGDTQDPPEIISNFLREWESGYENVYAKITRRSDVNLVRRINSQIFYFLASRLTGNTIVKNASDFRLIDRKVYLAVRRMQESNRFVRGLISWTGYKSIGIPMIRPPRYGGESKASTLKVIDLALKGIFAHTTIPLKLVSASGFVFFISSIVTFCFVFTRWILYGVPFAGYGLIVSLLLFGFGFTIFVLGIIGEYIGLIYEEAKNRPNYLVTETLNVPRTLNEK
jgi:glycosyltransferase involved in cell wall biosynthesis